MQALFIYNGIQQITSTPVGSVVLPVLAGVTVLYIAYYFFNRLKSPKIELDTPSQEEVIPQFLHAFFSGEWDAIETRIELEYFKSKVIQNDSATLRVVIEKLFFNHSPYLLANNQEQLAVLVQELEIHAFINRDIVTGTPSQQEKAIQWAFLSENRSAIPFLEKVAQQPTVLRCKAIAACIQLNGYQPTVLKNLAFQLNDTELQDLVALYADKAALLENHLNSWLIASQPQFVKFCLLLAKQYHLPVDSRTLQFLGFHQDKKLGALAMEILDGYLHQDKATDNLQKLRKTTILQHKNGETTPNTNSNLAIG
ncbi:MAG: hypothetical protein RLZZ500_2425 [Bacteroidota bacterium]|jgi:hypothetical protein